MFEKAPTTSVSITTGTIIRVALIAIGIFTIYLLRDLVLILLTSIVVASFVESSLPYFKKIGIGRVLAVILIYVSPYQ